MFVTRSLYLLTVLVMVSGAALAELRVPAFTGYIDPDPSGARVSEKRGVTNWNDPEMKVSWFGKLAFAGEVSVQLEIRLAEGEQVPLSMTVGKESHNATVRGRGKDVSVVVDFGSFKLNEPGYQSFVLESPKPQGALQALLLDGSAIKEAHFNLKSRRNAASVHLAYPVDKEKQVSAFYCEMTGVEDPLWTYYMACGWHRGYFGMQVNSQKERRIIFSVWDSGGEAIDRDKVGDENRVTLVAKGEDVYSGDFGNEGTGGHSHLKYSWKTGERQKFLVTAKPVEETYTIFAGYYFHPDKKDWMLISSWKAPKEGKYLRGLYSFSENFAGKNGHVLRKALYENQWIRTADGKWHEVTKATFSHDKTGKADRLDRFMGLTDEGQFFLSHGGFGDGYSEYGDPYTRPKSGRSPATMKLPE